jgi:hypothetical protein
MSPVAPLNVMLAYVPYPVTTAVYLECALRSRCRVTTIGPPFPQEKIEEWHLQNLKLPFNQQEIVTDLNPDMVELLQTKNSNEQPDLYLWIESVEGHFPDKIDELSCTTACYLIDTHINLPWHLVWAERFDHVFLAQQEYLPHFIDRGMKAHWLPLACDPAIHTRVETPCIHDICFVGGLSQNPRRTELLETLNREIGVYCERCWWDDMAQVFSSSRIVFNSAVNNDLNMRVFEALSVGSLLLTDQAPDSGLETLFQDGEDLAIYRTDEELIDVAGFYLKNSRLREQIATRGRQIVHAAHTYVHRIEELLDVVSGERTTTSTAEELRAKSIAQLTPAFSSVTTACIDISSASRSFVIPVLDYSPASQYNIVTLLEDLEQIPGDVLVIFNDEGVAADLKGHPRITRYAIMKENVGVARAWNVGIEMAATPHVFILNADLHLLPDAVHEMEDRLRTLERAACTGPQGSFVNYRLTKDYLYFDKGTFDQPVAVDAVSGFLFAVKRSLFGPGGLKFENAYTPCYFEEWDLGLQIRQLGLQSWIVPTSAYEHHWGGSIGARREISCMGRSESAQEILQRNRILFLAKWRGAGTSLAESGWRTFGPDYALTLLQQGQTDHARAVIQSLCNSYPEIPEVQAVSIGLAMQDNDMKTVAEVSKRLHRIDPVFDLEDFLRRAVAHSD